MKRFSEQLHNKAQSVKLQAFEREELRGRIVSYMEYHPLPATVKAAAPKRIFSNLESYQMVKIPFFTMAKWSAAVAVVVLIIVPVLAEKTVPGDSLYAVKVRFNEEVISTLTLNTYEKVEWETERLNRRIAEARLLASEGRLTDEVEVAMAEAVKEHTENVEREIDALREEDVDQATLASMELSTTLEMQSEALQEEGGAVMALALSEASSDSSAQRLVDVINESLNKQESQVEASAIPAYEKIMARVEMNTTRAYELLSSLKLNPEKKLHQDISRRLEDLNRSIEKSNNMRSANEESARDNLVKALEHSQKIIVFMSDAEVSRTTDIENVVPITYTPDEYKQQLVALNTEINRNIEIINTLNPQLSADISAKTSYAVEIAQNNQVIIASTTEPDSAVHLAKESLAVLSDAVKLIASQGINITTGVVTEPIKPTEPVATTSKEAVEEPVAQE